MNIKEAEEEVNKQFRGNVLREKTIETSWGWVFFSDADEGEFPVIFFDKYKRTPVRTRADNIDKRIEIYTQEHGEV